MTALRKVLAVEDWWVMGKAVRWLVEIHRIEARREWRDGWCVVTRTGEYR